MRALFTAVAAVSAFALAPSAMATVFTPADSNFIVTGNIFDGPISASFSNAGETATGMDTILQDIYRFTIPQTGVGSGSITTGTTFALSANDTDLISVFVNGVAADKTVSADGLTETFSIANVPITANVQNEIVVNFLSRGLFSYGGNATFNPSAVPEPATWAMMLLGFAVVGGVMRRKKAEEGSADAPRVRFNFG